MPGRHVPKTCTDLKSYTPKRWPWRTVVTSEINIRIARFHNIYGPRGTWKGGREKAPAAFCRKALTSTEYFEMWGDGKQTRSFTYIDDCVEGVLRLMFSDCDVPINLGTTEMVDMIEFATIAMSFEEKKLPIKHIEGPMGVRGRNSNNKLIMEKLGWEPTIKIKEGLGKTYFWIKEQIETRVVMLPHIPSPRSSNRSTIP